MKRFLIMLCLLAVLLTGCAREEKTLQENAQLNVYASFYPIYAIANLLTEGIPDLQLHCLVQPQDGCLRNYSLSDWDFALLRSADAILIGGRGLESFEALLSMMGEDGPVVSAALYNVELSQYDAGNETFDENNAHWTDANPHIYMKTGGAIEIAQRFAANLAVLDPKYEEIYLKNLEQAENRLKSLHDELLEAAGDCAGEKVAVLHEALVYAAEEYGLEIAMCYNRESGAALEGSSLESCIEMIRSSGASIVLLEKQAPQTLQEALKAAGLAVAPMDVLSTHRASEGSEGYFAAMRANAAALGAALEHIGGNS